MMTSTNNLSLAHGLSSDNCQPASTSNQIPTNHQVPQQHPAASAEGFHPGLQEIQDAWVEIRDAWTDINAERHDLMLLRQRLESQHRALNQPLLQHPPPPPPPPPPAAPAEDQPGGLRFRGTKGCWNCDSHDHVKANCPQPPRVRPKRKSARGMCHILLLCTVY